MGRSYNHISPEMIDKLCRVAIEDSLDTRKLSDRFGISMAHVSRLLRGRGIVQGRMLSKFPAQFSKTGILLHQNAEKR